MAWTIESTVMFKFKNDLYASFGVGFLIGLAIIGVTLSPGELAAIPQAIAGTVN